MLLLYGNNHENQPLERLGFPDCHVQRRQWKVVSLWMPGLTLPLEHRNVAAYKQAVHCQAVILCRCWDPSLCDGGGLQPSSGSKASRSCSPVLSCHVRTQWHSYARAVPTQLTRSGRLTRRTPAVTPGSTCPEYSTAVSYSFEDSRAIQASGILSDLRQQLKMCTGSMLAQTFASFRMPVRTEG